MIPKLVTVEEGADMLGLKRSKMYELLMSGEVESLKIGKARHIPVEALDEFIGRLRQAQAAAR